MAQVQSLLWPFAASAIFLNTTNEHTVKFQKLTEQGGPAGFPQVATMTYPL